MNQSLTDAFIDEVLGQSLFRQPRLLIWDSFRCHVSNETKSHLKKLGVLSAVIPGGCSKYVQAPDV